MGIPLDPNYNAKVWAYLQRTKEKWCGFTQVAFDSNGQIRTIGALLVLPLHCPNALLHLPWLEFLP